jgi:hypothetical protein
VGEILSCESVLSDSLVTGILPYEQLPVALAQACGVFLGRGTLVFPYKHNSMATHRSADVQYLPLSRWAISLSLFSARPLTRAFTAINGP